MYPLTSTRPLVPLTVVFALLGAACQAQFAEVSSSPADADGVISASGIGTVDLKPQTIRLFIELQGKAGAFEEAMTKLTDRRDAAKMQLQAMGFLEDTIEMSLPSFDGGKSRQQAQVEQMIRSQMAAAGRHMPEKKKSAEVVTLSATLTADLPLKEENPAEAMIKLETVKKQVREANLAGTEEQESELSLEQQEMIDEMSGMMNSYGGDEVERGTPYLLFVAKVTDETREQAAATAFKNAKHQAAMLARVAGHTLGPLHSLTAQNDVFRMYQSNSFLNTMNFGDDYAQQQYASRIIQRVMGTEELTDRNDEAIGANPASLRHRVMLMASFDTADSTQ